MPVLFANPAGFWALLAIPAIVLIHFLQRETRREICTTLFLLDSLERESAAGNRFEWLRQSPPLWLQLLAVLLLTWVLAEPRWLRPGSIQPVAFVLDSSASMQPFAGEARKRLTEKAKSLNRAAAQSEFFLLDSVSPGPALHHGPDPGALAAALASWNPAHGLHDFTPALRVARNLVGRQGLVILVTDHPPGALPFGSLALAVGSPLPNVGFAGVRVEQTDRGLTWTSLIRNYSLTPQDRSLSISAGKQTGAALLQNLTLSPGEIRSVSGSFPGGADELVLELAKDAFPLDDVLPVLAPRPRSLNLATLVSDRARKWVDLLVPAFDPASAPAEGGPAPDLTLAGYDPTTPAFPRGPAVVFVDRAPRSSSPEAGLIVAADHPLLEDLRWDALIVRPDLGIPPRPSDTPLLWIGSKPLIWLREPEGSTAATAPQLVFNFDLPSSNADRLPAFVLLLHRYAALVRQGMISLEQRLAETSQEIELPARLEPAAFSGSFRTWDGKPLPLPLLHASRRAALPAEPGFASLQFQGKPYLRLASHFADTREADLSQMGAQDDLADLVPAQVLRHSEAGLFDPLWILLIAAVLLGSWAWLGRQPT